MMSRFVSLKFNFGCLTLCLLVFVVQARIAFQNLSSEKVKLRITVGYIAHENQKMSSTSEPLNLPFNELIIIDKDGSKFNLQTFRVTLDGKQLLIAKYECKEYLCKKTVVDSKFSSPALFKLETYPPIYLDYVQKI